MGSGAPGRFLSCLERPSGSSMENGIERSKRGGRVSSPWPQQKGCKVDLGSEGGAEPHGWTSVTLRRQYRPDWG